MLNFAKVMGSGISPAQYKRKVWPLSIDVTQAKDLECRQV